MFTGGDQVTRVKRMLLSMQRHSWEQGVAMQAFLEQGDDAIVLAMAREAVYRALPDGRAAMMDEKGLTDPCSAGEALLHAVRLTDDAKLRAGLAGLLRWALQGIPRNGGGICYHLEGKPEFWVDSLYMLPPFLAAAGHGEAAMRQWRGLFAALLNAQTGLLSHRWDDAKQAFVRKDAWGVGNGWALASAARLYGLLPACRGEITALAVPLVDRVLGHMRPDGLFHDVIDDPNTFAEVNLSQMLAYTLYRGMADGWLGDAYAPKAERLYAAAAANVDDFGQVWQVCGAPHFDRPGTAPEGQAFFLLMSAARDKYNAKKE